MAHYQSFPNQPGAADSAGKLACLCLPPLAGKSFLDVGCNEGFFCGYAAFEAAAKVVGVDQDETALTTARQRFPYCDFRHGDWESLDKLLQPEETFDVILMASALHYAQNQPATIGKLVERLNPDGTLILELGIVENPAAVEATIKSPGWHEVRRSIDKRIFPDREGLAVLLAPYAYKHAGKSVMQIGDPLPRYVFHVQKLKPVAILLTGAPASGKSTLARKLGSAIKVIRGDTLLCKAGAKPDSCAMLGEYIGSINPQRIDLAIAKLCQGGGLEIFTRLVAQEAGAEDFIYDGYIPHEYTDQFALLLEKQGYRICRLQTPAPDLSPNALSKRSRIEARKYQMFLNALESARKIRKLR